VNIVVLLGLAWVAFLTRTGVALAANRRAAGGALPGLPQLPERSMLANRAAAFSRQPAPLRVRSRAAQRRLNVLRGLLAAVGISFAAVLAIGSTVTWAFFGVSVLATGGFLRALVVRRQARRQEYVEKLWARDRYDDLGHARVMSLAEARNRAEQIAAPVYVPARRIS
jgi:hypothetical protein